MISTINYLIRKLYTRIPKEVLEAGFQSDRKIESLDSIIHEDIIQNVVLADCNLYCGKIKRISLRQEWLKPVDVVASDYALGGGQYTIYEIPFSATENRPISHCIDISYPALMSFNGAYPLHHGMVNSASQGMDNLVGSYSNRDNYIVPTPVLKGIGTNIVELQPAQTWAAHEWLLSCLISFDKEFSNIAPNMVIPLFDCVYHATRGYIYNELIVKMDLAFLSGGQELSAIKNIVEKYDDAEDRYKEALSRFRGSSAYDKEVFADIISQIGI